MNRHFHVSIRVAVVLVAVLAGCNKPAKPAAAIHSIPAVSMEGGSWNRRPAS